MKTIGYSVIAVVLIAFIVLSGCAEECSKDSDCENNDACIEGKCVPVSGLDVYVGGNEGVVGKFVYPTTLYAGLPFDILVNAENKGEESIPAGSFGVYLSGVNWETYLTTTTTTKSTLIGSDNYLENSNLIFANNVDAALDKVTKSGAKQIEGGVVELDFNTPANQLTANVVEGLPVTFTATMCYPYKTHAMAAACLGKPTTGEKDCDPNAGDLQIDSSGAPIKVTKITESGSGTTNIFRIYFENVGKGFAYTKQIGGEGIERDDANCINSLTQSEYGKVQVESVKIDGVEIADPNAAGFDTTQTGCKITGTDKSLSTGMVTCQFNNKESMPTPGTIEVTLKYNYMEKIKQDLKVIPA